MEECARSIRPYFPRNSLFFDMDRNEVEKIMARIKEISEEFQSETGTLAEALKKGDQETYAKHAAALKQELLHLQQRLRMFDPWAEKE